MALAVASVHFREELAWVRQLMQPTDFTGAMKDPGSGRMVDPWQRQ